MMKPLLDRVIVQLDATIPTSVPGLIIPIKTDVWRSKDAAVESYNRGTVVAVGPGKRDSKGVCRQYLFDAPDGRRPLSPGDIVRFSELEYYEFREDGNRFVLITEADVVGVEVLETA